MRFDFLQSISVAGDAAKANDDRLGCGDALAWIIDGATDLGTPGLVGMRGGAAWIAMEANAAFAAAGDSGIRAICTAVFARLARRFDAVRQRDPESDWEIPSAAFLLARVMPDRLELGWLGDCTALLKHGDTISSVGPGADDKVAERAHATRLAANGLGQAIRPGAITDSLRRQRERPDRYVLSPQPAMADKVEVTTVEASPGDELLMMSDGFSALIGDYAAMNPVDLFAALPTHGLAGLVGRLRAIEQDDADCRRFPRFKRSDDASAIWLRIVA